MSKAHTNQENSEVEKTAVAAKEVVSEEIPFCGIIMPISASGDYTGTHWERVREIISEAIRDAKHEPRIVSDGNNSSIIHARIVTNIYQDDVVVCDVSNMNPNVMLEFGLRLASQKPIIVIKDSITKYSFDASPIEYIQYPRDLNYYDILEFKSKLTQSIKEALAAIKRSDYKSFLEHFTIPNLKLSTVKTVEVDQAQAINILLAKLTKIEEQVNLNSSSNSASKARASRALKEFSSSDRYELSKLSEAILKIINNTKISNQFREYMLKHMGQPELQLISIHTELIPHIEETSSDPIIRDALSLYESMSVPNQKNFIRETLEKFNDLPF